MGLLLTFIGLLHLGFQIVAALNVTIDNTSPQVIFSPTPCFQQDVDGCSPQWQLQETIDAFNGSFTTTTGLDPNLGLNVLPRVSLTFQGTSVVFMPGMHSTALASVMVDDLESILLNTSQNAFSGVGLDPTQNHTITITFVPSDEATALDVDYFLIVQPDGNGTSPSTSSFFPTPLPTSLPPTSTPPITSSSTSTPSPITSTSSPVSATSAAPTPLGTISQSVPTGTIAAVSLSGALVLVIALLTCFVIARRRRRRAALQREKAILYDLRLPSERGSDRDGRSKDNAGEQQWDEGAWRSKEKGKAREVDWRHSALPPVHYTPWR